MQNNENVGNTGNPYQYNAYNMNMFSHPQSNIAIEHIQFPPRQADGGYNPNEIYSQQGMQQPPQNYGYGNQWQGNNQMNMLGNNSVPLQENLELGKPSFQNYGGNQENANNQISDIVNELDMTVQQYNLIYNQCMIWFCFNSSTIKYFDFSSERFVNLPNPSGFKAMEYFRVAQLPNYSFIISGGSENDNYSNAIYQFDDCNFVYKTSMLTPRRAHSTIYNNGYVYMFGGLKNNVSTNECERYSVGSNFVERILPMSKERSLTSACNFGLDKIYIFGGYTTFGDKDIDLIEEFCTSTMTMRVLPFKLHKIMENPMVVQVNDEEVLIFGGYNDIDEDINTITAMNMNTGKHKKVMKLDDVGWSIYPPFYKSGLFYLFVTGEEESPPEIKKIHIPE